MTGFKLSLIAIFTASFMLVGLVNAFPDEADNSHVVPIARLIDKSAAFDGRIVTIEGEVIGDIMKRNTHVWISILDGGVSVGVWADNISLYAKLSAGGYGLEGDRVRVTGVMHRACPEHGGDFDIHLETLELLATGHRIVHPLNWMRVLAAILLCGTGLVFTIVWGRRTRTMRKA